MAGQVGKVDTMAIIAEKSWYWYKNIISKWDMLFSCEINELQFIVITNNILRVSRPLQ